MRWDRFFEDLENQLDSEWEAERAALDTETERLRLSRLALRDRLRAVSSQTRSAPGVVDRTISVDLADGTVIRGEVSRVGADWIAMTRVAGGSGTLIVPLAGFVAVRMPSATLLHSARADGTRSHVADRMGLGFVLRDVSRRRLPVTVGLRTGRSLVGTIDRAGADHLDLALHDADAARRVGAVSGYRLVAFEATVWVRVEADVAIA